jgi:dTDP-glucose 4,6-dehydratase
MKKVLITGSTGFIGKYLVDEFLKDHKVVCLVRPFSKNLDRIKEVYDQIEIVDHDIKYPFINVKKFQDIDIILHAGANPSAADSIKDPVACVQDNIIGTLNLLELARKVNVSKFVYYSSGEVFGPKPIGEDSFEDDAYRSNSPYAASKAAGEELCMAYSNTYNLPVSIVHINNTFGPMCQANRFPVIVIKKLLNDEAIDLHVGPSGVIGGRRWFHASDVAAHTRFILNNQQSLCEKWNSAGSRFIDNLSFAKDIAKVMQKELKYNLIPVDRPGHDLAFSVSPRKIFEAGWVPDKTFNEQLSETVEWYLNNRDWLYRN